MVLGLGAYPLLFDGSPPRLGRHADPGQVEMSGGLSRV